ncbi:hypothetical protein LSTR_LSTR014927 [Laodelphax striatellus]|uniref:Uncharacterized protein n=1 Tax=Laodelphax striatellus TaxID=195883 RepID=A0A482WSH5_LAOST|nr:hypothetical protein LSTR_LSTR014927 [Laodelphax striatellus]
MFERGRVLVHKKRKVVLKQILQPNNNGTKPKRKQSKNVLCTVIKFASWPLPTVRSHTRTPKPKTTSVCPDSASPHKMLSVLNSVMCCRVHH